MIQDLQVRSSCRLSRVSWYKCQRSELRLEHKYMNENFVIAEKTMKWLNFSKATLLSIRHLFCFHLVRMGCPGSLLNRPQTPYTTKDNLNSWSSHIHPPPCVRNTRNYLHVQLVYIITVIDKSKFRMHDNICVHPHPGTHLRCHHLIFLFSG